MANINAVTITGNLTRDPELRPLGSSGYNVCELSIALNERVKQGEEWVDRVSYVDVSVFGGQGQACADHLAKGRPVAITGRLRQDRWEKDGNKRSKLYVVANAVQFLPTGQRNDAAGTHSDPSPGEQAGSRSAPAASGDAIPF